MPRGIELTIDRNQLNEDFSRFVQKKLINKAMRQIRDELNDSKLFGRKIVEAIQGTDSWRGLEGAFSNNRVRDLESVLGLEDSQGTLASIAQFLEDIVEVRYIETPLILAAGVLSERKQRKFFDEDFASFVSENGDLVPWLQWLLIGQDDPVVGYTFAHITAVDPKKQAAFIQSSRTQRGLMVKKAGSNWNIESHLDTFSQRGNFILEAFANHDLVDFMLEHLKRRLLEVLPDILK